VRKQFSYVTVPDVSGIADARQSTCGKASASCREKERGGSFTTAPKTGTEEKKSKKVH
jgi:hypothetical protein